MKKEMILKLLKSPILEDILLGLNYIKDWSWDELQTISDVKRPEKVRIDLPKKIDGGNYILHKGIYCHINSGYIHVYEGGTLMTANEYIQL